MSIRLRLTILYTGILLAILMVVGGMVHFFTARLLATEVDRGLLTQAVEISRSARMGLSHFRNIQRVRVVLPPMDIFAAPDLYLQAVDLKGRVVARSANLGGETLPSRLRPRAPLETGIFETVRVGRERLRLYHHPLRVQDQPVGTLQVARSLAPLDFALARLRFALWSISWVGLVLAALLGWLLAGAGLGPIDRLTRAARAIGINRDFRQRIAHQGPPDEVGRLATTFNEMLDRLQEAYDRLEETNAAQRRFLADASHELRTPLTIMRGNLDVLQRMGDADPAVRRESLQDVAGEAERMSRLVNDLLLLARADTGWQPEKKPTALLPLLEDALRRAAVLAQGQELRSEGLENLAGVLVDADADYLQQLFLILLENAAKYTPAGGAITVSADRDDSWARVRVADTGPGIPPEDLPRLFDRFYRGAAGRERPGSGLGLAIARWLAEMHGGRIEAASSPGEGSAFTIWLPLLKEPPAA